MQGLQKSAIIVPGFTTLRLHRAEYHQHDLPIGLRQLRQHGRLLDAGHPMAASLFGMRAALWSPAQRIEAALASVDLHGTRGATWFG